METRSIPISGENYSHVLVVQHAQLVRAAAEEIHDQKMRELAQQMKAIQDERNAKVEETVPAFAKACTALGIPHATAASAVVDLEAAEVRFTSAPLDDGQPKE